MMTRSEKISAAIATSISEDRTVEVRVRIDASHNLNWIEEFVEGIAEIDYAANASVEDEPGECNYDVWGTTEDGSAFRLSVVEFGGC